VIAGQLSWFTLVLLDCRHPQPYARAGPAQGARRHPCITA